ncbi:MAG: DUF2971 domain-containing protein [Smithella sp.]|jgi:hypothetical protein
MQYPNIKHLYKYCAYNENSLFILRNRKIWLSDPEEFNDPFDCRYKFKDEIDRVEFEGYGNRYDPEKTAELKKITADGENEGIYNAIYTEILNYVADNLKKTGVFCLSHYNDNILMWSHYSDKHKGFLIEFERSPDNNLGKYAYPVKYVPFKNKRVTVFSNKAFEMKFLTKAYDWKYEGEWRLIEEDGKNKTTDLPGNITAIIFGLKMPDHQQETIKEILSGMPHIKYYKAEELPDQYKIRIIEE